MSDIYAVMLQDAVERQKKLQGYSLLWGVLDNDPKGKSGRGTLFYAKGTVNHIAFYAEWGLLDEINRTADYLYWTSIREDYLSHCAGILCTETQRLKQEKQDKLNARLDAVSVSKNTLTIIEQVLSTSDDLISQYKEGKEKALNSLIGKVIKQVKSAGISEEVFNISQTIKQKLT